MDDCLVSYTSKGKKIWSLKLPHNIICLESMDILSRGVQLAAVALANRYVCSLQYIYFNYLGIQKVYFKDSKKMIIEGSDVSY